MARPTLAARGASGAEQSVYEPGSYAPWARVDQAEGEEQKLYYFHTDQIGTPLEMTDREGQRFV